eukprot:m.20685 g.20685  ORF g.20685 m.20685 type:complete len:318 (+) comp7907_c0_seq1:45-998(+)
MVASVVFSLLLLGSLGAAQFSERDALLIIDVQNDFMEKTLVRHDMQPRYPLPKESLVENGKYIMQGKLGAPGSSQIIDVINKWIAAFQASRGHVLASIDWHQPNHCSFCRNGTAQSNPAHFHPEGSLCGPIGEASNIDHRGRCIDPASTYDFTRGQLMQWPDHCLAGSFGARFHPYLNIPSSAIVLKKGIFPHLDSYSAFDGRVSVQPAPFDTTDTPASLSTQPDLSAILNKLSIRRLFVVGIAADYCVMHSILDALNANPAKQTRLTVTPSVHVIVPAIRGVSRDTTVSALQRMAASGAQLATYDPADAPPAHREL